MAAYIIRRLLLIIPTVFVILTINFFIIQCAPGGPVDRMIATLSGINVSEAGRFTGQTGSETAANTQQANGPQGTGTNGKRGTHGLDPAVVEHINKQFGFDKPLWKRYLTTVRDFALFRFGKSYFRGETITSLIWKRLPVSISLGLWTTLLIYGISLPLGIAKAVRDGSRFDIWTSGLVIAGNAIPGFLFALFLIIVFASGRYFSWFPLDGLVSRNWREMGFLRLCLDYAWHMVLPVTAMTIGGFATLTMLTKNSFMDQINQQYVMTAYAKGLTDHQVLYGHVFRNAMLIVIAGFPAALIRVLFTGSLLIEVIFSLEGLGLLGFNATMQRDYPLMFANLYIFTLLGLILKLVSDVIYTVIDPRIDFAGR